MPANVIRTILIINNGATMLRTLTFVSLLNIVQVGQVNADVGLPAGNSGPAPVKKADSSKKTLPKLCQGYSVDHYRNRHAFISAKTQKLDMFDGSARDKKFLSVVNQSLFHTPNELKAFTAGAELFGFLPYTSPGGSKDKPKLINGLEDVSRWVLLSDSEGSPIYTLSERIDSTGQRLEHGKFPMDDSKLSEVPEVRRLKTRFNKALTGEFVMQQTLVENGGRIKGAAVNITPPNRFAMDAGSVRGYTDFCPVEDGWLVYGLTLVNLKFFVSMESSSALASKSKGIFNWMKANLSAPSLSSDIHQERPSKNREL